MRKILYALLFSMLLLILNEKKGFAQNDSTVYNFIVMKKPPTFPGGIPAFYEFLSQNIKYPDRAVENNIEATVKVSFMIEKDGAITNIEVPEKIGYGLDEEALRVIRLSPKWIPGTYKRKPVRVKYNIPIKFSLSDKPEN